ncbi:MAG: hypothetical protein ABIO70_11995 [Pseudomonadota bacterium]
MNAPCCPYCGAVARLGTRISRYRRGERVLAVEVRHWECPAGCLAEDGQSPLHFEDPPLLRANDEEARRAWLERFGGPMPPSGRPGRKPRERRSVRVQVLVTPSEAEAIDRARGELDRSEYIRRRVLAG